MQGSGTQASPYLIETCQDLQYAMLHGNGAGGAYYYKVTRDLDCNEDKLYEWNVSTNSNIYPLDIDFDGHYITNVNIKKDGWFYGASGNYTRNLHDGAIINVYENGAVGFIRETNLVNMAIDVHTNGFTQAPFQFNARNGFGINLCNIKYDCTGNELVNNSNKCLFLNNSGLSGYVGVKNSKITINGNYNIGDPKGIFGGNWGEGVTGKSIVSGCLIEGNIVTSPDMSTGNYCFLSSTESIDSSIVNLDISGISSSHPIRMTNNTNDNLEKNVFVQNNGIEFKYESAAIMATSEQVRNPDWLLSQGFFLGKEV